MFLLWMPVFFVLCFFSFFMLPFYKIDTWESKIPIFLYTSKLEIINSACKWIYCTRTFVAMKITSCFQMISKLWAWFPCKRFCSRWSESWYDRIEILLVLTSSDERYHTNFNGFTRYDYFYMWKQELGPSAEGKDET